MKKRSNVYALLKIEIWSGIIININFLYMHFLNYAETLDCDFQFLIKRRNIKLK